MSAIPSELCKPTPRRVHWEPLAWLVAFFVLAVFLCFPLALIFSSWRDVHIDEILAARGEIAKGGVLTKVLIAHTLRGLTDYRYRIDYEFSPPGAVAPIRGSDWVSRAEYFRLDKNRPVEIVFDRANASISEVDYPERMAFRDSRHKFLRALVIAPLFFVIGCAVALGAAYTPFRQRQLLRCGVPTGGRIVAAKTQWGGRSRRALLTYCFLDSHGVEIEGRSSAPLGFVDGADSANPAVVALWRAPIVLFDIKDSRRNMLYLPNLFLRVAP
jgi:hypothetical protein